MVQSRDPVRTDLTTEAVPEKRAVKIELDRPPQFIERRVDRGVVLCGTAAVVFVEHVEAAEPVDGGADRRSQAVGVGHVGTDRDQILTPERWAFAPGEVYGVTGRSLLLFAFEADALEEMAD